MPVRNLALLLIAVSLSPQSAKEPVPRLYDVQEAYDVYAAVLALDHAKGDLLIGDTTVPFNRCLESRSDKLADAAIENYKKANENTWQLQRKLNLKSTYKLLSAREIEDLRKPDPQGGFNWHFRRGAGVYHFSAVGFSADETIAFVEMDFGCGGMCGHGNPYILRKKNGKWKQYDPPVVTNPDDTYNFPASCSWYY